MQMQNGLEDRTERLIDPNFFNYLILELMRSKLFDPTRSEGGRAVMRKGRLLQVTDNMTVFQLYLDGPTKLP
jgi:hypothetical protein